MQHNKGRRGRDKQSQGKKQKHSKATVCSHRVQYLRTKSAVKTICALRGTGEYFISCG